ncbi:MAG: alpha-ketoacid dehydrogenase subunit beta [Lachnospiraceae bacterium]|nr:alpha-ketoacid dehydrogenase subunit beta [Lachnospiraceae bacterium]
MSKLTMAQAIARVQKEEMEKDPDIFIIGEDIGKEGGTFVATKGLYQQFGDKRVKDSPISESGFASLGVGAALYGLRPIVEFMFQDFVLYAMDAIVNQAAKAYFMYGGQKSVPIVFRIPVGAGLRGAAQHSQCLEAWYAHIPGLIVLYPSNPEDAYGMLRSAIRNNNPVIFFEHKLLYGKKAEVTDDAQYMIPIGSANVVKEGKDISIITYGLMVYKCLEAAKRLEEEGISCEVIDLRSLSPLDTEKILSSAYKIGKVVVVTEANLKFSVAREITAFIAESASAEGKSVKLASCGAFESPIPYPPSLEDKVLTQSNDIYECAKNILRQV